MVNNLKTSLLKTSLLKTSLLSAAVLSPLAIGAHGSPSWAQTTDASSELITLCRYDPNSGIPNVFGMRTYITLTEVEGNTNFLLEKFPAIVANPEATEPAVQNQPADVSSTRSLTLYNLPIDEARQFMIDEPYYYATLLDVAVSDIGDGFAAVDATLGCGQVAAEPESPPAESPLPESPEPSPEPPSTEDPAPETPPVDMPAEPTVSDLPNGNYRLVSADFPNRIVTDEELLESGGALFLFRKFGDTVTGSFSFIDHEGGSCITGIVEGNTITGDSFAYSDVVRAGTFLELGTEVEEGRYEGSVLNLEDFSRINAGTRLPVESCP